MDSVLKTIEMIAGVVALVVLSVLTFGAAAVVAIVLVGALIGLGCQLSCDIKLSLLTGKWDASWQDYVGAYLSTFAGEHLSNLTGGQKKFSFAISLDSSFEAGFTLLLGKIFKNKVKSKKECLSKKFKNVPALSRLA